MTILNEGFKRNRVGEKNGRKGRNSPPAKWITVLKRGLVYETAGVFEVLADQPISVFHILLSEIHHLGGKTTTRVYWTHWGHLLCHNPFSQTDPKVVLHTYPPTINQCSPRDSQREQSGYSLHQSRAPDVQLPFPSPQSHRRHQLHGRRHATLSTVHQSNGFSKPGNELLSVVMSKLTPNTHLDKVIEQWLVFQANQLLAFHSVKQKVDKNSSSSKGRERERRWVGLTSPESRSPLPFCKTTPDGTP